MKVKVRRISKRRWEIRCVESSLEDLQRICRNSLEQPGGQWEMLEPVLAELTRRRMLLYPNSQTAAQAWDTFNQHYRPLADDMIDPSTGIKLTPSYHGRECLGNGDWPGYECCCDECNYYLACFPEWK